MRDINHVKQQKYEKKDVRNRMITVGNLKLELPYEVKNNNEITFRCILPPSPVKIPVYFMRDELISLLAKELVMQKERGLPTSSVSRMAEAVCFSFDICRSETNSKPIGHTTLRIELGEKIEEYKENKEIYKSKK